MYEVELPVAVKQLLDSFSVAFSFGISYTLTPLECLGLHTYQSTLLFWMLLPIALVLIILLVSLGIMIGQRERTLASFVEVSLPSVLRALFIIYPLVTNTAFQAFPKYTFADGEAFLKVGTRELKPHPSC